MRQTHQWQGNFKKTLREKEAEWRQNNQYYSSHYYRVAQGTGNWIWRAGFDGGTAACARRMLEWRWGHYLLLCWHWMKQETCEIQASKQGGEIKMERIAKTKKTYQKTAFKGSDWQATGTVRIYCSCFVFSSLFLFTSFIPWPAPSLLLLLISSNYPPAVPSKPAPYLTLPCRLIPPVPRFLSFFFIVSDAIRHWCQI